MSIMSQSIAKISTALLNAQKGMTDAVKGAKNPFFKSNYADLNSVREAVIPSCNQHGITVMQLNVAGPEGRQFVRTLLLHESGEFIGSDTQIVCAKQNDPQALGSAISYARRYGLQSMLCSGAIDDDGEKAMGREHKPQPAKIGTVVNTPAVNVAPTAKVELTTETINAANAIPPKTTKFARPPKKEATKPESGDMF